MADELVPAGSFTSTLAVKNASVADELGRAGASFGNLVLTTGRAVAETQKKLTETGAATATELANTLVDVIAIQERVFDDQGNVAQGKTHVQHLPLVNFIEPPFYEWSQVRIQGVFFANEFASATSDTSTTTNSGGGVGINLGYRRGGFKGAFGASYSTQTETTSLETDADSDISYGNVRMNALLQPRRDIGVPKPTQIIQGPRLAIIHGSKTNPAPPAGIFKVNEMGLLIEYRRRDGTPIADKAISVEAPGVMWSFVADDKTDASGNLAITLRREFLENDDPEAPPPDTSPKDLVITARIGIVQNSSTVNF